jgi:hypothetical protein
MKLAQILDAIKEKQTAIKTFSAIDDHRTQSSREITIRQFKADVENLQLKYAKQLYLSTVSVFVTGGGTARQDAFQALAKSKGAIVVDSEALYKGIAARTRQHMGPGGKQMTSRAMAYIVSELMAVANSFTPNVKIPQVPSSFLNAFLETDAALVEAVRQAAATTGGPLLNVVFTGDAALQEARRQEIAEEPIAVIVQNVVATELPAFNRFFFSGRPNVTVNLDANATIEELMNVAIQTAIQALGQQ